MSRPEEYRIETMADFLDLSKEQRLRFIPDLLAWADVVDGIRESAELSAMVTPELFVTWIDDETPGRVAGIAIGDNRIMFEDEE
jgi:hypothetical protein